LDDLLHHAQVAEDDVISKELVLSGSFRDHDDILSHVFVHQLSPTLCVIRLLSMHKEQIDKLKHVAVCHLIAVLFASFPFL